MKEIIYRIIFSSSSGYDKWKFVVLSPFENLPHSDKVDVYKLPAKNITVKLGKQLNGEAHIVIFDKSEMLIKRDSIYNTEYDDYIISVVSLLKVLYKENYYQFLKDMFPVSTNLEGKSLTPSPIFNINSLVFIDFLYNNKWVRVFSGLVRGITYTYSKAPSGISMDIRASSFANYLTSLDFVNSLLSAFLYSDVMKSRKFPKEVVDLALALWLGQYPKSFQDMFTRDDLRGFTLLQNLDLFEFLKFIARVGNIRSGSILLSSDDVPDLTFIREAGINVKSEGELESLVNSYNSFVKNYSPLSFLSDFGGLFPEPESIIELKTNIVEETSPITMDLDEEISPEAYLNNRTMFKIDEDVIKNSNTGEIFKRAYRGAFDVSKIMWSPNSRSFVQIREALDKIKAFTFLETYERPDGSILFAFPRVKKSIYADEFITLGLRTGCSDVSLTIDADKLISGTSFRAGVDFVENINEVKEMILWGLYVDPKITFQYNNKIMSIPEFYFPVRITESALEQFVNFSKSWLYLANANLFQLSLSLQDYRPDLFYWLGNMLISEQQEWMYTVSQVVLDYAAASNISFSVVGTYGMPLKNVLELPDKMPWHYIKDFLSDYSYEKSTPTSKPIHPKVNKVTKPTTEREFREAWVPDKVSLKEVEAFLEYSDDLIEQTKTDTLTIEKVSPSNPENASIPKLPSFIEKAIEETADNLKEQIRETLYDIEFEVKDDVYGYNQLIMKKYICIGYSITGIKYTHTASGSFGIKTYEFSYPIGFKGIRSNNYTLEIDWDNVFSSLVSNIISRSPSLTLKVIPVTGSTVPTGEFEWQKANSDTPYVWVYYNSTGYGDFVLNYLEKVKSQLDNKKSSPGSVLKVGNRILALPSDPYYKDRIRIAFNYATYML